MSSMSVIVTSGRVVVRSTVLPTESEASQGGQAGSDCLVTERRRRYFNVALFWLSLQYHQVIVIHYQQ
jgi:hypothetical protein